ncbi:MAG: histidine phosphatase family protein [Sphingobium sp.]|nr:histidine phosphatase family protein [Sphingobium sp.]
MKTLILLRHAKSDWGDAALRDFDRPLNSRGERAAVLMGTWARREQLRFDKIVASPAARVKGTLDRFGDSTASWPEPVWDQRIYLASVATLAEVVGETDDDEDTVLLVGHNPGMEEFVLDHVSDRGDTRLRDDVAEKFPTAAIAVIDFDVDHWADVARGRGTLRRFIRPRDLDPALGPERD